MTLQNLRDFGRQEELTSFLDGITDELDGAAQAVCLTYDRYWLAVALVDIARNWPPDYWPPMQDRPFRIAAVKQHAWFSHAVNTIRPPDWEDYCETRGYPKNAMPVIIKIMLRRCIQHTELPRAWENYPILYIQEPPCHAYTQSINTGDNLGQASPDTLGTLGGVLQHRDGTFYISTAAHVLPNQAAVFLPSPTRRKRPTHIATYKAGKLAKHLKKCNAKIATKATDIDFALCTLDINAVSLPSPINAGVTRWSKAEDMTPTDPVAFCGARTQHGVAQIADTTLWCEVEVDGEMRCYGDCFAIEPRHKVYINTALAKPGDSGAWIIYDGNDPLRAFDGTIIGGTGSRIYCSYAENVKAWCDSEFGRNNIRLP